VYIPLHKFSPSKVLITNKGFKIKFWARPGETGNRAETLKILELRDSLQATQP
jgi:hypothetical protein